MTILDSALAQAQKRRTIRHFDSTPIDMNDIRTALNIAATAPSLSLIHI